MEPDGKKEYFDALTVVLGFLSLLLFFGVLVNISIVTCGMITAAMAIVLFMRCYLYIPTILRHGSSVASYDHLGQMLHQNGVIL